MTELQLLSTPQVATPERKPYLQEERATPEKKAVWTKGSVSSQIHTTRMIDREEVFGYHLGQVSGLQVSFEPRSQHGVDLMGMWGELVGAKVSGLVHTDKGLYFKKLLEVSPDLPESPLRHLSLSEVFINETKIKLSEPLYLNVQFEDQHFVVSHDDLGLLAASSSLKDAVSQIQEEFSILWNDYVNCPDEELTEGAKRFRDKLERFV